MNERDELLQTCLEEMSRGASARECLSRHGELARGFAPLLLAAERLRLAPAVVPSPAYRVAARARMLNLIAANPPLHRSRPGFLAGVLGWPRGSGLALLRAGALLLALVVLAGGLAATSASALPGEPLYPARLAMEQARLGLAPDDHARELLRLDLAEARCQELAALALRAGTLDLEAAERRYEAALAELGPLPDEGSGRLEREHSLARQRERLQAALTQAGPEAVTALERALGALERHRIEHRLREREGAGPVATPAGPMFGPSPVLQTAAPGPGPRHTPTSAADATPTATPSTPGGGGSPTEVGGYGAPTATGEPQGPRAADPPGPTPAATPSGCQGEPPATPSAYQGEPPTPTGYQAPPATPTGYQGTPPTDDGNSGSGRDGSSAANGGSGGGGGSGGSGGRR